MCWAPTIGALNFCQAHIKYYLNEAERIFLSVFKRLGVSNWFKFIALLETEPDDKNLVFVD